MLLTPSVFRVIALLAEALVAVLGVPTAAAFMVAATRGGYDATCGTGGVLGAVAGGGTVPGRLG